MRNKGKPKGENYMKKYTPERLNVCRDSAKALAEEINSLAEMNFEDIPRGSSALIAVDIVNGFIREGAMASPLIESIIKPSAELMKKFAAENMPAVVFADCHEKGCAEFSSFPEHCLDGTSESEPVDEIKAVGGYVLIKKNSTNGFHEAAFRDFLGKYPEITTFVVIGDCTDICVLQFCLALKTYFNSVNRVSEIIVPADCAETYDAPAHSEAFMNLAAYKIMSDSGVKFVKTIK